MSYESKVMPHITMAGFFKISEVNFGEFDQIRLAMPSWATPGHYVMLWDWQGYVEQQHGANVYICYINPTMTPATFHCMLYV